MFVRGNTYHVDIPPDERLPVAGRSTQAQGNLSTPRLEKPLQLDG